MSKIFFCDKCSAACFISTKNYTAPVQCPYGMTEWREAKNGDLCHVDRANFVPWNINTALDGVLPDENND